MQAQRLFFFPSNSVIKWWAKGKGKVWKYTLSAYLLLLFHWLYLISKSRRVCINSRSKGYTPVYTVSIGNLEFSLSFHRASRWPSNRKKMSCYCFWSQYEKETIKTTTIHSIELHLYRVDNRDDLKQPLTFSALRT